jgi:hypothetical protein
VGDRTPTSASGIACLLRRLLAPSVDPSANSRNRDRQSFWKLSHFKAKMAPGSSRP